MLALKNTTSKGKLMRYKVNGVPKSIWVGAFQTVLVRDAESADDLLNAVSRNKNRLFLDKYRFINKRYNTFDEIKGFFFNSTEEEKWKGQIALIENASTNEFDSATFVKDGENITLYYKGDLSDVNEIGAGLYSYPSDDLPYEQSAAVENGDYRLDMSRGTVTSRSNQNFTNVLPEDMGIIINSDDPTSSALALHYRTTWDIPVGNVVTVSLGSGVDMGGNGAAITTARNLITTNMPPNVQWLALCFRNPSRAGANSITWAITMGYDSTVSQNFNPLPTNPMWNFGGSSPFDLLGIRPSMMVYNASLVTAAKLAHGLNPVGTCYMVAANDQAQQPRGRARLAQMQALVGSTAYAGLTFDFFDNLAGPQGSNNSNNVLNKTDLMFYFNGMNAIYGIDTNTIQPGAIGDYVTSTSGNLPTGLGQTPISYLLDNGFVGAAGSVIEPWQNAFGCTTVCGAGSGDLTDQFPNIQVLVAEYKGGKSLIEAYWKSLKQPPRILLIGDPMVAPFASGVTSGGTPVVSGCTNPYATNFNPLATLNDGSCSFPEFDYLMNNVSTTPSQLVPTQLTPILSQPTAYQRGNVTGGYMKVETWGTVDRYNIHYPCNFHGMLAVRYTEVTFKANSYQWLNSVLRIQPHTGGGGDSEIVYVYPDQSTFVVDLIDLNVEYASKVFNFPIYTTLTSAIGKNGGNDNNACYMQFQSLHVLWRFIR